MCFNIHEVEVFEITIFLGRGNGRDTGTLLTYVTQFSSGDSPSVRAHGRSGPRIFWIVKNITSEPRKVDINVSYFETLCFRISTSKILIRKSF